MIIGFCGKIGAGKDTAGAYLVEKYGFERISFAAKLKESAAACFGINPGAWEHLKNNPNAWITIEVFGKTNYETTEVAAVTAREFLQRYGTEAHREVFGSDFWVDQALKVVPEETLAHPQGNFVVTDIRFNNEAAAIRELGGRVIQIHHNGDVKDAHASEAGISEDLIDGKIANIGTIEQLYLLLDAGIDGLYGSS